MAAALEEQLRSSLCEATVAAVVARRAAATTSARADEFRRRVLPFARFTALAPRRGWAAPLSDDDEAVAFAVARATLGRGYFRRPGLERMLAANAASGAFPKELFTLAVLELWHREFLDGQASRSARAEVSPGLLRAR